MPGTKPTVLGRQLWGRQVAVEVRVESGETLGGEIGRVRRVLNSSALGEVFLLVAGGTNSPGELARRIGKSKFAVSVQLAALKRTGLVKLVHILGSDMRRKSYEINWSKIGQIFRQDHALELEIYENQLSVTGLSQVKGSLSRVGLAVSGNGKLGLVREIIPDELPSAEVKQPDTEVNRLIWEFTEFFKGYVRERRFKTIREYLLGAYEELSEHYGRLPKSSELGRFHEFTDRAFTRITPIEQIWKRHVPKKQTLENLSFRKQAHRRPFVIKLFAEAGSVDSAGRYVLNAEVQAMIKPGTPLKIYPAYSYS